jgi:hypothetical protein
VPDWGGLVCVPHKSSGKFDFCVGQALSLNDSAVESSFECKGPQLALARINIPLVGPVHTCIESFMRCYTKPMDFGNTFIW